MTSNGLDDFFIPPDDNGPPEFVAAPTASTEAVAPRGIHAPSVPAAQPPEVSLSQSAVHPPGPVPSAASAAAEHAPASVGSAPTASIPATSVPQSTSAPAQGAVAETEPPRPVVTAPVQGTSPTPARQPTKTREQQLSAALGTFMRVSADVEAAALVSLDGFIMASALPEGMQEDRVGAMSAAILGLGERAAAELGRGRLTQVFIEGDTGYVLLMAAGDRAVLTALARLEAKLGLLLYDMRDVAEAIADILG